ncbi:F0F1 ATP synthase subunit epsilon [Chloroflexia bacterium SDU3-3]|nr:F0F1 ATP synthase subunit epsilon [Chloroflexia bacterium SDU3-3]
MPMHLEIVTPERLVLSDEVDQINAPTKDGRVGILPRHEALLTILDVGELDIIKNGESTPYAISGGFMEVASSRVTILADTVERADEIDEARAAAARQRAETSLANRQSDRQTAAAEASLKKALIRLRVSQLRGRVRGS